MKMMYQLDESNVVKHTKEYYFNRDESVYDSINNHSTTSKSFCANFILFFQFFFQLVILIGALFVQFSKTLNAKYLLKSTK